LTVGFKTPVSHPQSTLAGSYTKRYAAVLDNPFANEPVKLGFGTLVDTRIGVARVTTTLTANADGSLMVLGVTSAKTPLRYNSVPAGTNPVTGSSWSSTSDGAWGSVNSEFSSARPIAFGLKLTPILAATDKIVRAVTGVVPYDFSTGDPNTTLSALNASTNSNWFGSHLGSKVIAGAGTSIVQTWRPMSLRNFEFDESFFADNPAATSTAVFPLVGPVVFCAIQGPASLQYDVELIYYYEALAALGTTSPGTNPLNESASDHFSSLEQFYRAAQQYLNPENVGRATSAAGTISTLWRTYSSMSNRIPYHPTAVANVARPVDDEKSDDEDIPLGVLARRRRDRA